MWDVSTAFRSLLQSRSRDLIVVFEFYDHDYTPFPNGSLLSFDPRYALKLFAGQTISFSTGTGTVTYERQVIEAPSINKHISKQFDTASLKLSNVDRSTASWVLNNPVQGMRMVVRLISRASPLTGSPGDPGAFLDSVILFVGRCNKPDGFNRSSGTISANQDLGTIQAQIPPRLYQSDCPLKFKGAECLGSEALSAKSATYKAAKICNKSFAQCTDYSNTEFFQGVRIVQIESSFVHKSNESFFKKILNILPGISRKKTVVGSSIHDGTPYGKPISLILGRWQKDLIPLQFQDIGTSINFKMAACRGTIRDFLNIRNESSSFTQPIGVTEHLGEYGGVGSQTADTVFPDASFHSKLAYITGYCNGTDIATEDPAPQITSLVAGIVCPFAYGGDESGRGRIQNVFASYDHGSEWTDNPVNLAFFVITEPSLLNVPPLLMAQKDSAKTAYICDGAIKDTSNSERCLLPNTETSRAGVDYKRYLSTGVVGPLSWFGLGLAFLTPNQSPGGRWDREATYEFFDPASPPTSLSPQTFYRKRYTANVEVNEQIKAVDFLFDRLLPSFRGFLKFDQYGRIHIDNERPADHSFLRANVAAGATSVKVLDVFPWDPPENLLVEPDRLRGKILIGTGLLTSEVRPVTSTNFSADGNSITLSASSTSGDMTAIASGATLTSGSSSVAASGGVVIDGNCAAGDVITITIDGYAVSITATQEHADAAIPDLTMAEHLAFAINAEPGLRDYVEARRTGSSPTTVAIACKFGVLNFSTALEEDHFAEIDDPTAAPTLGSSAGALAAGAYLVAYAYRNANGNTNLSPIASITLTASKQIDVTGISLPTGADSVDWFVSVEANSGTILLVANNNGSGFSINALPETTEDQVPNRNTTGEEITRVMMSFAGKALTYADTTRANVLDGSFGWPEGGRQSTVNQVKGKFRYAIQDFAEQPITVNDELHQEQTGQVNSSDLDLSCVDNYWQARYLCNGVLAKLRDTDFFFKHASAGEVLLLEVGDVICLSDDSGAWRNVPVRIEDVTINTQFEAAFVSRLYSTHVYDDEVLQIDVPLPSALTNFKSPPAALTFNTVDFPPDGLVQSTDGTAGITSIRGGLIFADSVYAQYAKVRMIKRGGVTVDESINDHVDPDSNSEGVFEFVASTDGLYTVQAQACNQWGCSTAVTASIIVGFGSLYGLAMEDGFLLLTEAGDIIEVEH